MDTTRGIKVIGPIASGKSTLASALATALGYQYLDIDAFKFQRDEFGNVIKLSQPEVAVLLEQAMQNDNFVVDGFHHPAFNHLDELLDAAFLVKTPVDERVRRFHQRQNDPKAKTIPNHFINWVYDYETGTNPKTSLEQDEYWLENLPCLTGIIDGTKTVEDNVQIILAELQKLQTQQTQIGYDNLR